MMVELTNGARVAVGSIFCIGRNYAEHISEMNPTAQAREIKPVVFCKPRNALNTEVMITLPSASQEVHYETEIVVLLGKGGKNLSQAQAHACIQAYGVGLDLTARDWQQQAKQDGLPWTLAKGFDGAASVSQFIPASELEISQGLHFSLTLNGEIVQRGHSADMLWTIDEQIAYISQFCTLSAGDLLFTGTPAGVGRLQSGDNLQLNLMDSVQADFKVS